METDEEPLSPEASLRLIDAQRERAHRQLDLDPSVFLVPWGLAWLIGYGLFFLRYGPDERVLVSMPGWLPLATLLALLVAAGASSGVAGESAERGAMYGWSWALAFAGFGVLSSRFEAYLPEAQFGLLMGSLPVLITAILYMSGGAVWRDRHQFGFGVWLSVINGMGLLAGPGWHSLVISVLGGGGMLASAAYLRARRR